MSKIYSSPFKWGEPVSGNHYLQRQKSQNFISSSLEKHSHLILSGYRGTGKTSLIRYVLDKSSTSSIYLDLRFIVCRDDVIKLLLDALETCFPIAKTDGRLQSLQSGANEIALSHIFDLWHVLVKQSTQKFIVVWDEFQHLVKLKENLIEELREALQGRRFLTHVFVSHRQDILNEVFGNKKKQFFNNHTFYEVGNLDLKNCSRFLSQRFRRMGLSDFDLPDALLKITSGQAQLTQKLAHALAQIWLEGTTTRLLPRASTKLLTEHNDLFTTIWDEFGVNEKRLILGLASGYSRPTELGFIKKFNLSATSTAHNTVTKLVREGWLINKDEGYHIYNPLFLNWLQNRPGLK